MDSKYSSLSKVSFSLKRNSSNISNQLNGPPSKKPHLNVKSVKNNKNTSSASSSNVSSNKMPQNANKNGTIDKGQSVQEKILQQQKQLPVFAVKTALLKHLMQIETLIVIGETGSGKTTQIPQYLYQDGLSDRGLIAVTQPRRVAAITIATRVAKEMKCQVGDTVGYTVRFEDTTSKNTKIRFITDGSLLREALSDRLLKQYRCIILDEAHERTINTDILFGIVKDAQKTRKQLHMTPLKIIIMSATMDVDHFSKYFNNCKTIYLVGRTYPIRVMHAKYPQADYMQATLSTLFQIHETAEPNHDILIFLTGQEEIETMVCQIRALTKVQALKGPTLRVYPLYAQLAQHRQMDVFSPSSPGTRKVIISTNIAETSLTISGIKYVIDCGMVKRRVYDSATGMDTLKVIRISRDQAWQRCGRAGRESDGFCYRTYTVKEFNVMPLTTLPEILRSNICSTVLQLLAMGVDCENFDFIDAPSPTAIENALKQLKLLGAIKSHKNELTRIGKMMAKFPLDPKYSKMLLTAPSFGCLEEMLSLVAIMSSEEVFLTFFDSERRAEALVAQAKFENKYGDHLTLLNVFKAIPKIEKLKLWCHENFLNGRNLTYANEVRKQLSDICKRLELEFSSCGKNFDQVRKCLLTGLLINIAELHRGHRYVTLAHRQRARIHPSSILSGRPRAQYIIYSELVTTGKTYMRNVTSIEPEWIDEIIPDINSVKKLFVNSKLMASAGRHAH